MGSLGKGIDSIENMSCNSNLRIYQSLLVSMNVQVARLKFSVPETLARELKSLDNEATCSFVGTCCTCNKVLKIDLLDKYIRVSFLDLLFQLTVTIEFPLAMALRLG
jgi:hypothetical protein